MVLRLAQRTLFVDEVFVSAFENVQLRKRQHGVGVSGSVNLPDLPKHARTSLLRKFAMQYDDRLQSVANVFVT